MNKREAQEILSDIFNRLGRSCLYIAKGIDMSLEREAGPGALPVGPGGRIPRNPFTGEEQGQIPRNSGVPAPSESVPASSPSEVKAPAAPQPEPPKAESESTGDSFDVASLVQSPTGVDINKGAQNVNAKAPTDEQLLAAGAKLPRRVVEAIEAKQKGKENE